jgi:hypothetical protein
MTRHSDIHLALRDDEDAMFAGVTVCGAYASPSTSTAYPKAVTCEKCLVLFDGLMERGLAYVDFRGIALRKDSFRPIRLSREGSYDCEFPNCDRMSYPFGVEGRDGYVVACPAHARRILRRAMTDGAL